MSDVIARMRLESQDFDNKLKSATANLQHMEREVRRTGATFEYADKEEVEFLRSLGSMETKAMDAKGKIKELSNSYKELAMIYERMTDAEKASEPGKTLAASLQQIKTRLNDTKQSFERVQNQIGEGNGGLGGALDQLSSKFGINITKLAGWGAAVGVAKAALDVMKDAFFANEGNLDEWGRTVESTKSLYQGFLNALNNGDISGFLSRMDEIVSGARKAYDAMDELGTFTAFNQRNVAKSRADYAQALDQYRLNPTAENKQTLSDANNRVMSDLRESHQKTEEAYQAALRELAQQRLSSKDLQDAFVKAFSEGNYGDLQTLKSSYSTGTGLAAGVQYFNGMRTYGGRVDETGSGQWRDMTDIEKQQFEFSRALSQVTDSQIKEVQALGAQSIQITEQIYQQDRAYNRLAGNNAPLQTRGGGKSTQVPVEPVLPEGSAAALKKQIADLQDAWNKASTQDERNSIKGQIDTANEALKAMTPQIEPVAAAIKDAAAMWTEHSEKIADVKARLAEFKAMATDSSLTDEQREWAQGMAESYQEQLDKMTGATEEAANNMSDSLDKLPTKFEMMQEALDNMSTGVGAISTIGNAFNELKGIGEDLASAFSGEMDAWDALMTVFNSGIGIMQTVIGVMEAINTLQELSAALSKKKVVEQAAETTAVVSGKGAEAAAETAEAAASGTATAANTAEAASGAGAAMAGIPIMGPVLAVAAIAAVLAAVLAATSKAKSAGKFASGGVVGGNSYSGDRLMAYVNSGETILTPQQADRAMNGIEGSAGSQRIEVTGKVRGQDILLSANNTNRAAGGSRGYYTKVK